jgi:hypothetical protein
MRVTNWSQEQIRRYQIEPDDLPEDEPGATPPSPSPAPAAQANPQNSPAPAVPLWVLLQVDAEPNAGAAGEPAPASLPASPPAAAPAPAPTATPPVASSSAWRGAPFESAIDLETDGGSTQLRFNASQQAFIPPAPPPFAPTATASAAALATAAPAPAYVGERPADATWLTTRETALIAVRNDYEAQRAQAQAQVPSFGSPAGPGWVVVVPSFSRDGSELAPAAGQLSVEVHDPNVQGQYSGDENNNYTPPPSQRYIFDEAAFTQHYQASSNARPDSALQTLARSYNTDAASLLKAHPDLWAIATSDHAINAGPAQAGRAMGSLQMLAPIEMMLADPQNAALIKAYGGSPEPATSPIALEQVRLYGAERYAQMCRLSTAMQAVRDQYSQAVEQAANSGSGPGWSLQPQTVRQHAGSSSDGDSHVDVVVMQPTFDVDAFTTWYQAQGGLANQAFKDCYGASHTSAGGWMDNGEGSGTWAPSSTSFDNANWQMTGFGGALQHSAFTSIDPNNHPSLNDDAIVGFDPVSGWITPTANLHQKQDWVFTAAIVAMVVVVSCVTYGAASGWATGAGYSAAAGAIGGAAAGAAGSFVSGALNDNLTFKGVLQGALAGALAGGAGDLLKLQSVVPAAAYAPGTAGGFVSNFTINTAVQALMQGKITDQMLLTTLAGAAGTTLAANMASGIDKAVKAGAMSTTEAFAAQSLAKVLTAAVRAMANPDDPGYAFANALLNEVMQPLGDAARDAGAEAARGGNGSPAPTPSSNGQTAFDDDGNLMPGIVNPQASPEQQRTQLANQLRNQGMPLTVAHLMAQQALGGDVGPPITTPTPTANAPADTGDAPTQSITVTGRALPQDAYGNRYELTPEGHVVVYQQGGGLVRVDAQQAQASGLAATLVTAAARVGAGAAPAATTAIALPELGALLLRTLVTGAGAATLLVIPGNNSGPITTTLGKDERFVQSPGEAWGWLEKRDPTSGEWSSQIAQGIRNGASFEVLTPDQLARLQGPLTTPITPPQPSGPPPSPIWVDNNRPNPGYVAAPSGPTTLVTPAAPQPTAADLILNKTNADKLAENLEKAGKPKPAAGYQPHHMVPSRDGGPAMQAIRDKLALLDLDLNDAANGIWLPCAKAPADATEAYHPRLTNDVYNEEVVFLLSNATTKEDAVRILETIASQLQANTFPGVRPRPNNVGGNP